MADLIKTAVEYCEHEKRRKDCELCPDELRLELLTDKDMLLMVEKGIRSGITQAVKRCAKANNKYMKDLYNPDEESIYLQYLDANGSKSTNTRIFMEGCRGFYPRKIDELVKKDKRGSFLEVNVKYSKGLHENHNELLFLAERMKIGTPKGTPSH